MASSSYSLFLFVFLLAFVAPSCSWYIHPILRHLPHPWVFNFIEDIETLSKPWIAVDEHALITTLANTPGFKIASALLKNQACRLTSLLLVDVIYRNGTRLFIPNCDAITIYIRPLENETQIIENYPGIVDEIASGRRHAVKQRIRRVTGFNSGGNVSVSHPFIYSDDEEGTVAVHGADKGFGALESQIRNLSLYGPYKVEDYFGWNYAMRVRGVNGLDSVELPLTKEEETEINKLSMKIEMVIVANIVPTPSNFDHPPGFEEKDIAQFKQWDMPYEVTMIYSLHF